MRKPLLGSEPTKVEDMTSSNQGLDVGESRMERMKKMLSSPLIKKRSNSYSDKEKTFGVSLVDLLQRTKDPGTQVPLVVKRICEFIERNGFKQEGLFRVSGSMKAMDKLRNAFDKTGDANLEEVGDVMATACLLKQFLRELPEPVISANLHDEFVAAHERFTNDREGYTTQLKKLVERLPEENFNLLKYLVSFLVKVARAKDFNRMGPGALGIVFGPNIFKVSDGIEGLQQQTITNQIVTKFIVDYTAVFEADSQPEQCAQPEATVSAKRALFKSKAKSAEGSVCRDHATQSDNGGIVEATIRKAVAHHLFGHSDSDGHAPIAPPRLSGKRSCLSQEEEELEEGKMMSAAPPKDPVCSGPSGVTTKKVTDGHSDETVPATPDVGKSGWGHRFATDHDACFEARRLERLQQFGQYQRSAPSKTRRAAYRSSKYGSGINHSADGANAGVGEDSLKENDDRGRVRVAVRHGTRHAHRSAPPAGEQSCKDGEDRPSSPGSSAINGSRKTYVPPLDLTTLHQHADGSDPIPTNQLSATWPIPNSQRDDDILLSPRCALLDMKNSAYLDVSLPPSPPVECDEKFIISTMKDDESNSASIKHFNKRIQNMKRKIKQFEEAFEEDYGYRPSHAEKMARGDVKKYLIELARARKELKQLKEEARMSNMVTACPMLAARMSAIESPLVEISHSARTSMEESLEDMMQKLLEKRLSSNRPEALEEMSNEQVSDEKLAIQKALLMFESVYGRPCSKLEKELMKPIYERYRCVKRMVAKINSPKSKDAGTELQPIKEHEIMDFAQSSPKLRPRQSEDDAEEATDTLMDIIGQGTPGVDTPTAIATAEMPDVKKARRVHTAQLGSFNLHELSHSELLEQQWRVRGEKKRLRRTLKDFEEEFLQQTGRKVHHDDRAPMEPIYEAYKQAKAKLKLLEALLSKHDHHYTV